MTDLRVEDAVRRAMAMLRPRDEVRPAFIEGLVLGAMVGAAIAGSTFWNRRRRQLPPAVPRLQGGRLPGKPGA